MCVDTAGGGQSCTAVCTGFYTNLKLVLLGAESLVGHGARARHRHASGFARPGNSFSPSHHSLAAGTLDGRGDGSRDRSARECRTDRGGTHAPPHHHYRAKLRRMGVRFASRRSRRPFPTVLAHDEGLVRQKAHRYGDHAQRKIVDALHVTGQTKRGAVCVCATIRLVHNERAGRTARSAKLEF